MEPEDRRISSWAIYAHPHEHPDGYVLREWISVAGETQPGDSHHVDTLAHARALLPHGVTRIEAADPDPMIVETYV